MSKKYPIVIIGNIKRATATAKELLKFKDVFPSDILFIKTELKDNVDFFKTKGITVSKNLKDIFEGRTLYFSDTYDRELETFKSLREIGFSPVGQREYVGL